MGTSCTESVRDGPVQTLWIDPSFAFSFDHLVSDGEQRGRYGDAKHLGGVKVDNQLEFGWLLDRDSGLFKSSTK
jgi:hypothetical protein